MREDVVVVVAGGEKLRTEIASLVRAPACVLAADGGLAGAQALGLEVDVVVGDLDSAQPEQVARAASLGARVERHPEEKDATDLELALDAALAVSPARVVVLADGAGRLDHLLASLLLLGRPRYAGVELDGQFGGALVHVVRGARTLDGTPGDLVSLLALHGAAEGVTTAGLRYPLSGETLEPGSSRGVSNVFSASVAHVEVATGVVLAVRPEPA